MTGKRVPIGLKPGAQKSAEEWVTQPNTGSQPAQEATEQPVATKRLTIDVPVDLHRRLKMKAASEDVRMKDLVRRWIEEGCA
jgi:hypothetical protein